MRHYSEMKRLNYIPTIVTVNSLLRCSIYSGLENVFTALQIVEELSLEPGIVFLRLPHLTKGIISSNLMN